MQTISRAQALSQGLTHYFTGKPCKRGHLSSRLTANHNCYECATERKGTAVERQKAKEYRETLKSNPDYIEKKRASDREYNRKRDPKRSAAAAKAYRESRTEEQRLRDNAATLRRQKERRREEPQYLLACRVRTRTAMAVRGSAKRCSTTASIGCSWSELRAHIESQFLPDMSWDNRDQWDIDHIKPLASFDLTDPEQFRQACHYTNLQPLWSEDNRSKGARLDWAA